MILPALGSGLARAVVWTSVASFGCLPACTWASEPPPAVAPAPAAEAPPPPGTEAPGDPTATLAFGPPGTRLVATGARHLVVPGAAGTRRVDLLDASGARACSQGSGSEEVVLADVDGDGARELFVVWTWYTGMGTFGAVPQIEVCGWRWRDDVAVPLPADLTHELGTLGVVEAQAIERHLAAKRAKPHAWTPLEVTERPRPDDRTRVFTVGSLGLHVEQTGLYGVALVVVDPTGMRTLATTLYGLLPWELDAGSRPWDFADTWDEIRSDGQPACCAFDLTRPNGPRVSAAWTRAGSTFVEVRQEQTEGHAPCLILQVADAGVGVDDRGCAALERLRDEGAAAP